MDPTKKDIATQYKTAEHMTGPFSRLILQQYGLDRTDGSADIVLLDNTTGTRAVLMHLYDLVPPAARARLQVVAGDLQPAMVKAMQERAEQNGWTSTRAQIVNAMKMDLPADHFTHVVSSFALAGIRRVLRPAGVAAFTIWKSVGWLEIARGAVERIPDAPRFPTIERFSASFARGGAPDDEQWIYPAFFEREMRRAGFEDVETVLCENRTGYEDAEACVQAFLPLLNFAAAILWSEEERKVVEPHLAQAMLEAAKTKFGDWEVVLDWEAYCVMARKPSTTTS